MSNVLRNIFHAGRVYKTTRDAEAGFARDHTLKTGTDVEYQETKYSPYDGCYVFYFRPLVSSEPLEVWIQEDTPADQIESLFAAL